MTVQIPHDGWIAVCDGAKAQVFHNTGTADQPQLASVADVTDRQLASLEQGEDRPDRKPAAGAKRAADEQSASNDRGEDDFLGRFCVMLGELVAAHHIKHLTLAAAPRALGMLRPKLPAAVAAVLKAEISADYAHLPKLDLQKRFTA